MPFDEYLRAAVVEPLGLRAELRGSPASGLHGTLDDLLALAPRAARADARRAGDARRGDDACSSRGSSACSPDFGRFDPNDWGLGFELRDAKSPHWTGTRNSPRTFGHFGGSGTFLWIDPDADAALACLTARSDRGR